MSCVVANFCDLEDRWDGYVTLYFLGVDPQSLFGADPESQEEVCFDLGLEDMEDGMESILFTLLGRYLTLFNRPSLALAYFTAAATADPDHLPAQYGVARCLAQQGHILEASTVALQSLARLPEHPTIRPKLTHDPEVALEFDREDELDLEDMQVLSLVCLVAELAPRVPPPAADTVLPLLGRLGRFFASSASFAVEAVARHWLPLACVTVADICQNAFVQRALRESETFGAMALEGTVCTTRHELLLQVLARRSHASDSSVQPNLPGCDPALDLPAACVVAGLAAIAEHCHFVQYCVPVKPDEHNLLGTLSVLIEGKLQAFDANDGSNRDSDSHRLAEPNPNHSTTTAATCSNEDSVICLTELVVALAMYENLGAALGDKVVGLLTHARLQHLGLGDAVAVLQSQVMDVQEEQKLSMALVECSAADVSRYGLVQGGTRVLVGFCRWGYLVSMWHRVG